MTRRTNRWQPPTTSNTNTRTRKFNQASLQEHHKSFCFHQGGCGFVDMVFSYCKSARLEFRSARTHPRDQTMTCQGIRDSLRQLYLDDPRPWPVGFSGGWVAPATRRFPSPIGWERVAAGRVRAPSTLNHELSTDFATTDRHRWTRIQSPPKSAKDARNFSLSASIGERVRVRCRVSASG